MFWPQKYTYRQLFLANLGHPRIVLQIFRISLSMWKIMTRWSSQTMNNLLSMYGLKPMMLASGLQTAWEQIDSMRKVPNNFRFYIVLDVEQRPWSFKVEVIMWYLRSYYKAKVSKIIIFILYYRWSGSC